MNDDPLARVRTAAAESALLRAVAAVREDGGVRFALGATSPRPLADAEITTLERLGNWADDWSRVRVAPGFDPCAVRASNFHGDVVLGTFTQPRRLDDALEMPSGIQGSTLIDCVVGHNALVHDVKLLCRYVVGAEAVLYGCGRLTCDAAAVFAAGLVLSLAIETGGRNVPVFAEIDVATAAHIARGRHVDAYARAVADYAARAASPRGIIEQGAVVRDTPRVRNAYLGPYARVDGALQLDDCTLLSNAAEPVQVLAGACVRSAILQWGSRVDTCALVERSVLTEHAHAERHAKVSASIIGPNTGVAEGEVTASLLGPFVGFHHQALLIAAFWPEGKGNVAHGACVGSNHTSRAPDQEFWPGEGAYLGLGVNIKYPADFSRAPYTVIAMGVSTLPQKLTFPFSLVNKPWTVCPGVSPAYNEIIPAWVLTDNLYMLKRNEEKYRARNRARRTHFDFTVFRPDTVQLMREARSRLEAVPAGRDFYTDRDIDGLGKNFLREPHRQRAIDAYRFFSRLYALLGLKERLQRTRRRDADVLEIPSAEQPWEHQRQLLRQDEGLGDVAAALRLLPEMLETVAQLVERSKAKDDARGRRIIDDYAQVHVAAAQDDFVLHTWTETRRLQSEVEVLLRGG